MQLETEKERESVCLCVCLCRTVPDFGPRITLKPRPHQQQCRSNIVECYKSNDCFDKFESCFDIFAGVDGALVAVEAHSFVGTRAFCCCCCYIYH